MPSTKRDLDGIVNAEREVEMRKLKDYGRSLIASSSKLTQVPGSPGDELEEDELIELELDQEREREGGGGLSGCREAVELLTRVSKKGMHWTISTCLGYLTSHSDI